MTDTTKEDLEKAPEESTATNAEAIENPETRPEETTDTDDRLASSLETLVKAAERRGYLRARNEIAQAAMDSVKLWENPRLSEARRQSESRQPASVGEKDADTLTSAFLTRLRPSIWDE